MRRSLATYTAYPCALLAIAGMFAGCASHRVGPTTGRELVELEYSWESRARAYEELYQRVIEERRARTAPAGMKFRSGTNGR